jgi:hypothetical protein
MIPDVVLHVVNTRKGVGVDFRRGGTVCCVAYGAFSAASSSAAAPLGMVHALWVKAVLTKRTACQLFSRGVSSPLCNYCLRLEEHRGCDCTQVICRACRSPVYKHKQCVPSSSRIAGVHTCLQLFAPALAVVC